LAAIRETFEETGVLIGRPGSSPDPGASGPWRAFLDHGVMPALAPLRLVARAITPAAAYPPLRRAVLRRCSQIMSPVMCLR
jgi:8-oxo-dGTP pyrophosphatase MutT (NUDIX family)